MQTLQQNNAVNALYNAGKNYQSHDRIEEAIKCFTDGANAGYSYATSAVLKLVNIHVILGKI